MSEDFTFANQLDAAWQPASPPKPPDAVVDSAGRRPSQQWVAVDRQRPPRARRFRWPISRRIRYSITAALVLLAGGIAAIGATSESSESVTTTTAISATSSTAPAKTPTTGSTVNEPRPTAAATTAPLSSDEIFIAWLQNVNAGCTDATTQSTIDGQRISALVGGNFGDPAADAEILRVFGARIENDPYLFPLPVDADARARAKKISDPFL